MEAMRLKDEAEQEAEPGEDDMDAFLAAPCPPPAAPPAAAADPHRRCASPSSAAGRSKACLRHRARRDADGTVAAAAVGSHPVDPEAAAAAVARWCGR